MSGFLLWHEVSFLTENSAYAYENSEEGRITVGTTLVVFVLQSSA
jgi:hypothetical protein